MKKLFSSLLLVTSTFGFCQAQITFRPEIGGSFSTQRTEVNYLGISNHKTGNLVLGGKVGLSLNIPFSNHIGIMTGLYYENSGVCFKDKDSNLGVETKSIYRFNGAQLPLYVSFFENRKLNEGFFAAAGPYVKYYFSGNGKVKTTSNSGDTKASGKLSLGYTEDHDYKPMDFGLGITFGYAFKQRWTVRAFYNYGLTNLVPSRTIILGQQDDYQLKRYERSFGVIIGYRLGK